MKKIIVMLLVLAVFVCGVFAEDTPEVAVGVKGTTLAEGSSQTSSMTMYFNPIRTGVSYFNIGFAKSDSTIKVGTSGHLEDADSNLITNKGIALQRVETTSDVNAANIITGSISFKLYYEVITTEPVAIDLEFNPFTLDDKSLSFSYTKGSDPAVKVSSNNTSLNLKSITSDDTKDKALFADVVTFGIKTDDAANLKAGTYSSNVVVKITHNK